MSLQAAISRPVHSIVGSGPKTAELLRERCELLEEENRQLRSIIADLTGQNEAADARSVFGFTRAEASVFMVLARCGRASYRQLEDAVYSDRKLTEILGSEEAIRTHVKRMRRKIRPFGVEVRTVYQFGYSMDDDMRTRARALLASGKGQA